MIMAMNYFVHKNKKSHSIMHNQQSNTSTIKQPNITQSDSLLLSTNDNDNETYSDDETQTEADTQTFYINSLN